MVDQARLKVKLDTLADQLIEAARMLRVSNTSLPHLNTILEIVDDVESEILNLVVDLED